MSFFNQLQDSDTARTMMDAAIAKFTKYGRGIVTASYTQAAYRSDTAAQNESTWNDLCNANLVSIGTLKSLLKKYARRVQTQVNDPDIFGDQDVVFIHLTQRGEEIEFTPEDCYLICRAAVLEQQSTKEYRAAVEEREALQDELERLQTPAERRKSAQARLKELNKQLDPATVE